MKVSEAWLREWVNPSLSTSQLVHTLTMAGLEVDAVEPAAPHFSGVVVGQIETVDPHPDAEKLRVCMVTDGMSNYQVVCGASNATQGLKIPFAKVGAELPSKNEDEEAFVIKKAKLRGVESLGMLCGASELGLEDIVDGLLELPEDAPVGNDFREYLQLEDPVIEVDLTPNRGDCLSLLGIAREVGVLSRTELKWPKMEPVAESISDTVQIELSASDYCPRYAGRVVRNVNLAAETPLWMRERLRRAGLRCIDCVVDITNYVMLELGQPMHAFDLDKLGAINVRRAVAEENAILLDDSEVKLDESMLVIADGFSNEVLAVAGVMGGATSAVSSATRHIFFESAYFEPSLHAGKARALGMHTDSSHRFERGVDAKAQERAIERATALLIEIAGGDAGPVTVVDKTVEKDSTVVLQSANIKHILGFELEPNKVEEIFSRLEFRPVPFEDGWHLQAPSHRFDINVEADLLEELARIYGYDNLPVEPPVSAMEFLLTPEQSLSPSVIKQHMVGLGYRETINYSFIDPEIQKQFFEELPVVTLQNPISSDMSVMRTSLLPGLISTAKYNLSRQQKRFRLFETGMVFLPNENDQENPLKQINRIAALITGERLTESWLSKTESVTARNSQPDVFDFYDLKADVESLLSLVGQKEVEFRAVNHEDFLHQLHPGQSAIVSIGGENVGCLGVLHPKLQKTLGLDSPIWVFDFDLNLISQKKVPKFKGLSKFPEVRRDLAIMLDKNISVGDVCHTAKQASGEDLVSLVVFDRYSGEGVVEGQQSIGIGLTWQHPERTLNDDEVTAIVDRVVDSMKEKYGATLR